MEGFKWEVQSIGVNYRLTINLGALCARIETLRR